MVKVLMVFLGGGLGASLRYLISVFSNKNFDYQFPVHTFGINILGSFILGLITALLIEKMNIDEHTKLFLTVGFTGGLTTFSTFSLEAFTLFKEGNMLLSFIYIFASVFVCLISIYLGFWIAKYVG